MNLVVILGRLCNEPEIKYAQTSNGQLATGNYTIAVDRPGKKEETDFIRCRVVGKTAEFAEKFLHKGMKIAIEGSIRVDNYTDKDGNKKSTTYVLVQNHEFCESKSAASGNKPSNATFPTIGDDFMRIPEGVEDELLPF